MPKIVTKTMKPRYSSDQIFKIREQSAIYQCACPAQICVAIAAIRRLYEFQTTCIISDESDTVVHRKIAAAAESGHKLLEDCLTEVLELEGWDMEALKMPVGTTKKILSDLE